MEPSDTSGLSHGVSLHFLSSDRTKGGHVLNLDLTDLRAEWDLIATLWTWSD